MKHFLFIILLCIAASCTKKANPIAVITKNPADNVAYPTANTLTITGDFDGDGQTEVLIQDIADSTGTTVKYIPETPAGIKNDTTNEGWYKYNEFYSNLNYRTRLRTENIKTGDLYLDNCQGLYCLINVGNINSSKGDEIALVIDRLDQSRHNYCNIFTLCNGTWRKVFTFSVHEDAFDGNGDTTVLKNISGVLEFKDSEWKYYDYMEMPYDNIEDVGKMLPLKVPSCNENINLPLTD